MGNYTDQSGSVAITIQFVLQKAILQARSGIERANTARTGFYSYGLSVRWQQWVEGTGYVAYDVTRSIEHGSLSIHESLNDEVDTASFTLLPTAPIIPKAGEPLTIRIGGVPVFAGQCIRLRQRWLKGALPLTWYDVECVDHLFMFDSVFVTNEYTNMPGADIIRDVVTRWAPAFSLGGVDPALPVVPTLSATNQRPSTVLRTVTAGAGGAFFIATNREIHAWGANGDIRYATPPRPLTQDLQTLKTFSVNVDASQVRTSVIVEGQRTTTPLALPAAPNPSNPDIGYESVPLEDGSMFERTPGASPRAWLARMGTQNVSYKAAYGRLDPSLNFPGSHVTYEAPVGQTWLNLDSTVFAEQTSIESRGWVAVSNQILSYSSIDPGVGISGIPATGYGSIQASIGVGSAVNALPILYDVDTYDHFSPTSVPLHGQPPGQAVVLSVFREDDDAQYRWGRLTGTNGVRAHLIQDGRFSRAGAEARGDADLAEFKDPRTVVEWDTEDMNAEVGRPQAIDLLGIQMTLTITDVAMSFPVAGRVPRRVCRAATVRSAGLLDLLLTDPR